MATKAKHLPSPVIVDGVTLPANPTHQRLADVWLKTGALLPAAREAGMTHATARKAINRPDVQAYIAGVRQRVASHEFLSLEEIRRFSARLLRSKISDLDPDGETGDLIADFEEADTDTGSRRKIKKYDPFKWVELDLRLSGDDPQQDALTRLAQALTNGCERGLPKEKM